MVTELPELMDSIEAVAVSYFGIMVILSNGSSTLWLQYNVQTSFSNGLKQYILMHIKNIFLRDNSVFTTQ